MCAYDEVFLKRRSCQFFFRIDDLSTKAAKNGSGKREDEPSRAMVLKRRQKKEKRKEQRTWSIRARRFLCSSRTSVVVMEKKEREREKVSFYRARERKKNARRRIEWMIPKKERERERERMRKQQQQQQQRKKRTTHVDDQRQQLVDFRLESERFGFFGHFKFYRKWFFSVRFFLWREEEEKRNSLLFFSRETSKGLPTADKTLFSLWKTSGRSFLIR